MKKLSIPCMLLCLILMIQAFAVPVLGTEVDDSTVPTDTQPQQSGPAIAPQGQADDVIGADVSVMYGCNTLDAQFPLGGSGAVLETARSALLYEMNSETMLYAYNPDMPVQPASLTKILTTLIVLENADLDKVVTATESALSTIPGDCVTIEIKVGETFTIRDLLYGAMVGSGNDACAILAEEVAGSQEAFVAMMNQRIQEIGCTGTNFTNVHGLPDTMQYTTARDLGKIVDVAMENEDFREIFGKKNYYIEESETTKARYMMTNNYFISKETGVIKFYDPRATGGRAGEINTENRSMVCTAESGDMQLMIIVMEAKGILEEDGYSLHRMGNMEETQELLEWGFKYFTVNQVLNQSKSIAQLPVANGENQIVVHPVDTAYSAIPYGATSENITWKYLLDDGGLTAPVSAGIRAGTVQLWYGGICLAESEIRTMNSSPEGSPYGSVGSGADNAAQQDGLKIFLQGLGITFAAILAIFILYFGIRMVRGALIQARRRARRESRRRSR